MRTLTIAVDVDGVLAEQVIPVLQRIKDKYGINVAKEQITEWEYRIGNTDIRTEIELAEMEEGFVKSMPLIEGCREALDTLNRSFRVMVATSRHPVTDSWTREWLSANGIKYYQLINTYAKGKNLPDVNILIDDYVGNIEEFITSGSDLRQAILFSQPWNIVHHSLRSFIAAKQVHIANGWSGVIDLIRRIISPSLGI